jgi:hypothetical protein
MPASAYCWRSAAKSVSSPDQSLRYLDEYLMKEDFIAVLT